MKGRGAGGKHRCSTFPNHHYGVNFESDAGPVRFRVGAPPELFEQLGDRTRPRDQVAEVEAVAKPKTRLPIAPEDVPLVFSDTQLKCLAAHLPRGADKKRFTEGVPQAALNYTTAARLANELYPEIVRLHRAATRRQYEQVADRIEKLSPKARELLSHRARRRANDTKPRPRIPAIGRNGEVLVRQAATRPTPGLPLPDDLRDATKREEACIAVEGLCQFGGRWVQGRKRPNRPSGKRSYSLHWEFYVPKTRRNIERRRADLQFVMDLRFVWLEATGKNASWTAHHSYRGPFARLVCTCLGLLRARVDGIGLINELNRRRRNELKRLGRKPLSGHNS
jgi:hypothetical protein